MERQPLDLPAVLTVAANPDDIAQGQSASATQCAVALATKRALGMPADSEDISVMPEGLVTIWNGRFVREYDLGPEAQAWIERFDLSQPVEPRAFKALLLPPPRRAPEEAI